MIVWACGRERSELRRAAARDERVERGVGSEVMGSLGRVGLGRGEVSALYKRKRERESSDGGVL